MTEQISNKDLFYQIPQTQDDPLWEEIKEKMNLYAPPEKVEGMEHYSREVLAVSKAIRKSGEKNSNINLTRFSNPDRDNLNTIETRGLNVTCYPPKTVITTELVDGEPIDPIEEDLFGGYGRSEKFDELGINFWVYDRYVPSSQFGAMQKCLDDVFEDGGISDNGKVSSKAPSKQDYVGISLLKMERYGWKELELRAWYDSIEHALNDTQITSYIKDAIRIENAQGRIDWKDQQYVKQQAKTQKLGKLIPLNTDGAEDGNRQRFERILVPAMKEYLKTHETQSLCLHNTKVSNHQDYDDANEAMVALLKEDLKLISDFVDHWRVFKTDPIAVTHRVTEKIGEDDVVGVIVPFDAED